MAKSAAQDLGFDGEKGRILNGWYSDMAFALARENANVIKSHRKLVNELQPNKNHTDGNPVDLRESIGMEEDPNREY